MVDARRIRQLLEQPGLERLVDRLRRNLETGGGGVIQLTRVSEDERAAVESLLGRRPRAGRTLRVDRSEIETIIIHTGAAPDLRAALETLGGPIVDVGAVRAADTERWRRVFEIARPRALAIGLEHWLAELEARGGLKRSAERDPERAAEILDQSLAVLQRLPARGIGRGTLAAGVLHDAHGLDPGRPVAGLVRSALASWFRDADGTGPDRERALWARAGVLVGGDITSTVLALDLQADGEGATGRMMNALTAAGEPGYLTLRQLVRDRPRWAVAGRDVFVCENPAVVAEAAEHLGNASAPLIATLGRPSAAALTLLGQLRDAGARLHYRGDLDWSGISIANDVIRQFDARPWRLDVATLATCSDLPGSPLHGRPVEAHWDKELARALSERGSALQEEQLIDALLADLADAGRRSPAG
jgi:uncharacterized protein (TIGR02679 family)